MTLLPAGVDPLAALGLIALSALTSALTASVGIGGGIIMLVAMAFVLPVPALIPVHGVVQLGSNAGRAILLARSADLGALTPFVAASVAGALVGGAIVTDLPERALLAMIGAFVLLTTWTKPRLPARGGKLALLLGGFLATVLTMFVGATGPFVVALLRQLKMGHKTLVATTAVAMSLQHGVKIVAFGVLGFAFAPWVPLAAAMIAAGFLGTMVGTRLLDALPDAFLKTALKWLLTVLALQLLLRALLA